MKMSQKAGRKGVSRGRDLLRRSRVIIGELGFLEGKGGSSDGGRDPWERVRRGSGPSMEMVR